MNKIFVLLYVYFMSLHASSTFAHHQEVKIALHSLSYHHTYGWPSGAQVERGRTSSLNLYTYTPRESDVCWTVHHCDNCRIKTN